MRVKSRRVLRKMDSNSYTRRDFLALTTSQVAGLAIGASLAGVLIGYLLGSSKEPEIITRTETETLPPETPTQTFTHATTSTKTATSTTTSPYIPPVVESITWKPIRVVNDKIYDINVRVEVSNHSRGLEEVKISLIPVKYELLPKEGFPLESERSKIFSATGLEREVFSVDFFDLKGGREYDIKAVAKDMQGINSERSIRTPYIREFENIAPLDDVLVGTYYYPWYSPFRHWREGYKGIPLLGEYDSRDPIVISKHVDWATGHGIDFFLMSWWGPNSFEDITIKDYFLKNPLANHIKVGILYESTGRLKVIEKNGVSIDLNDLSNRRILLSDFNYLADTYFDNPYYLRINNVPVVELYLARIFEGNVSEVISDLREQIHNLYLIGDLVYWQDPTTLSEKERIKLYDAVTAYNMHTNVQEILNNFEDNVSGKYDEWFKVTKSLGVGFIPSVLPGFDDRTVRVGNTPLPKSLDRFEKQMQIARSYIDHKLKMIIITTFNEWHEYTSIEPSMENSFEYLQIIKNICIE